MIFSNYGTPYKVATAKEWNCKPRTSPFLKLDFLTFLLSQDKV